MVLILITIVLAALFAPIERKVIDTRITTGILADLDHKELTAWRIIAWTVCAVILIAFDAIIWWKAIAMIPACMAAFATAHRLLINHLRERPLWYLGIGSWYDRKLIEAVLWLNKNHEDLREIASVQHYNRLRSLPSYRKAVRSAGLSAYAIEAIALVIGMA